MRNNGPTFTKATYDHKRPRPDQPSPGRIAASLEQSARDCEDQKLFRTNPAAWLDKHIPKKQKHPGG
jgi:hypothetical protein